MSKDKYSSIFLKPNGGYCVYYPSNIFRNTHEICQSVICQSHRLASNLNIHFETFELKNMVGEKSIAYQ